MCAIKEKETEEEEEALFQAQIELLLVDGHKMFYWNIQELDISMCVCL